MATISNTPRPGYVWDATDNVWYPIGTGTHSHSDYITSASAINPTIVDAKGDIIAASAADTVARLAVGANDTVLTADSSTATGLKWAAPAAGGMTLLSTTTLSGATVTISSISQSYNSLFAVIYGVTNATANGLFRVKPNDIINCFTTVSTNVSLTNYPDESIPFTAQNTVRTSDANAWTIRFDNYASTASRKPFASSGGYNGASAGNYVATAATGFVQTTNAITSLVFSNSGGNLSTGTVLLYGVK
jgi:hypothetical protein